MCFAGAGSDKSSFLLQPLVPLEKLLWWWKSLENNMVDSMVGGNCRGKEESVKIAALLPSSGGKALLKFSFRWEMEGGSCRSKSGSNSLSPKPCFPSVNVQCL